LIACPKPGDCLILPSSLRIAVEIAAQAEFGGSPARGPKNSKKTGLARGRLDAGCCGAV
jgi:hypothetical protein